MYRLLLTFEFTKMFITVRVVAEFRFSSKVVFILGFRALKISLFLHKLSDVWTYTMTTVWRRNSKDGHLILESNPSNQLSWTQCRDSWTQYRDVRVGHKCHLSHHPVKRIWLQDKVVSFVIYVFFSLIFTKISNKQVMWRLWWFSWPVQQKW